MNGKKIFPTSIENDRLGAQLDGFYVGAVGLFLLSMVFLGLGIYISFGIILGFAIMQYGSARLLVWRERKKQLRITETHEIGDYDD